MKDFKWVGKQHIYCQWELNELLQIVGVCSAVIGALVGSLVTIWLG